MAGRNRTEIRICTDKDSGADVAVNPTRVDMGPVLWPVLPSLLLLEGAVCHEIKVGIKKVNIRETFP
jgi:hypothetical protein